MDVLSTFFQRVVVGMSSSISPIRIGILEFADLSLGAIVRSAQLADGLGYSRYWLAEHLGGDGCTGGRPYTNSLLMVPVLAGLTERIRVGPAGVLLRYFAAAAVARDAVFLEQAFGRVDLGLAAGTIPTPWDAMFADQRAGTDSRAYFDAKAEGVARWLSEYATIEDRPELWLHTSSGSRDRIVAAIEVQGHLAVCLFQPTVPPPDVIRIFRDESEARDHTGGRAVIALALACVESERERDAFRPQHTVSRTIVDTPARCRERVEELCNRYDADEVVVLESSAGFERRAASLQMLAEAFGGLSGPAPKGDVPNLVVKPSALCAEPPPGP
jgi:alkanesulfonate monooxygenase SsuD/methylene tetrahydromethanopterin reductase-like flavin-dependent oxidoreductase (luciferase family)